MDNKLRYCPSGDSGIIIYVGNEISEEVNRKVRSIVYCIENRGLDEVVEIVPSYNSILLSYDPLKASYEEIIGRLEMIGRATEEIDLPAAEVITIPVLYGGDFGIDLDYVAGHNKLPAEEVVRIHSSVEYLVYLLGFTPGFPYLGGMPERIAAPRLESPRDKICAGAVGIAGSQTGIYPIDSPGGWRIIGKTPVKLFDPEREPAVLLKAGSYIRFRPIDAREYEAILRSVEKKDYLPEKSLKKGNC